MNAVISDTAPAALIDDIERDAEYFEYTSSANPIGAGITPRIPYRNFAPDLYADGPSRVVPLDLSAELGCAGPATGPGLCAHFVRVRAGEQVALNELGTSRVLYAIAGAGRIRHGGQTLPFGAGDFIALPGDTASTLHAEQTASFYYVDDAPLLRYLGVQQVAPRFAPTRYPAARAEAELAAVANDPKAGKRNRISILLGNRHFPLTRTVTHVMWAMFGIVPPQSQQKPHRHQSIALDFIVDCAPGCYTLCGTHVDAHGSIVDPVRIDWTPGMAFVTPPGHWHAHFNESDQPAHLIPIQDAGLQTYLRALDIRFTS